MNKKKTTKWLLLFIALPTFLFGQQKSFWQKVDATSINNEDVLESYTKVNEFETFALNYDGLKTAISSSPLRGNGVSSSVALEFPVANGEIQEFTMYKVQTMSPVLASKFTSIQSYIGVSKDKQNKIRITLTRNGLYGMVSSKEGTIYINPYNTSHDVYQVFNRRDSSRSMELMECLVEENSTSLIGESSDNLVDVDDSTLRTYRMAVATTGEYSQYHINQAGLENGTEAEQIEAVLVAIIVTIDRINEVYERDLSVTMTLVDNNEDLIYLNGSDDPFTNSTATTLINESQSVINSTIGFANYDIGHTFSTGAGGLAQRPSVCTTGKARGVTGTNAPVGDPYDIDFVAHEVGHQFGGSHTFNGDAGNCGGGNRSNPTAVEPGSGTTIMAYAGICPGQNVQNNSDPYFHAISIEEMYNNISFGASSSCGEETPIDNTAPIIVPTPNYTIPYGTAFTLTASATDLEGDQLTYVWEQTDNEITPAPPTPTATGGPVFRSIDPSEDPTRFFPNKSSVISGNLAPNYEVIPNVARELNFAVTVRDNNILGGQSSRDDVTVTVANTGPFQVTSHNTSGIIYAQNEDFEVTWDVANTDNVFGVNSQSVNIYLSYNAGLAFTEVLATNVPNDGSHIVTAPVGTSSAICRIKIEAADNIFYALNSSYFRISNDLSTEDKMASIFSIYPNPNNGEFTIQFNEASNETYKAEIYDLRGRLISSQDIDTSNSLSTSIQLNQPQSGIYLVKVGNGTQQTVKKLVVN